jgi:hypothetical protein
MLPTGLISQAERVVQPRPGNKIMGDNPKESVSQVSSNP